MIPFEFEFDFLPLQFGPSQPTSTTWPRALIVESAPDPRPHCRRIPRPYLARAPTSDPGRQRVSTGLHPTSDTAQLHGLHPRIPHDDPAGKRSARRIRAAKTYLEDETEATIRGSSPAAARATFESTVNFIEMPLHDTETGARYVVTVAKGANRIPAKFLKHAQPGHR